MYGYTATPVEKRFFADSISAEQRGTALSIFEAFGRDNKLVKTFVGDAKVHDSNFAFLSTELAKMHTSPYAPKHFVTYDQDVPMDVGGGFVDYVSYFTVEFAGMMNEFTNTVGNSSNVIPRINAGLNQHKVNVFTFEVAYDLRFVELEKMNTISISKTIKDIYEQAITVGWDFFCQKIAYEGVNGGTGLFNSPNVSVSTIDNSSTTGQGFEGLDDTKIVSWLNGLFETYLIVSGMNPTTLPNHILVPTFVGSDLSGRMNELYTSTLRKFIVDHNLAVDEGVTEKIYIGSRPALNTAGTANKGRIVAYKLDKDFVRMDIPYGLKHYITLPNIDKMSYTSAFVGQVSEVQMPYNPSANELGIVSYWDFTN